jgi:Transposase
MRRARWWTRTERGHVRAKLSGGRTTRRGSVALNQRQYCEAEGIPLKAFGNWRAMFKAEPQPSERKLLYRRRGLSPPLSPGLSPPLSPLLSPGTYPSSSSAAGPIVPRPREGHRRRFSEADKRRILDQAGQAGASAAEIARRYGIDGRVLRRWKQELSPPAFVAVEITDVAVSVERPAS